MVFLCHVSAKKMLATNKFYCVRAVRIFRQKYGDIRPAKKWEYTFAKGKLNSTVPYL